MREGKGKDERREREKTREREVNKAAHGTVCCFLMDKSQSGVPAPLWGDWSSLSDVQTTGPAAFVLHSPLALCLHPSFQ